MNIATGEVLTELHKGHAGSDVLRFFEQIDASIPVELDVHAVLDNRETPRRIESQDH
ncbi:hypothetical protein OG874_39540 [Nocardia sp. NBC_00565]|uniref:hypothetical protein n=1 Tax=Nocardia sp. NBC_00565 TaxID=2975993 RepID=UPI002E81407F|nr:hypothetical protein [Nocardia sp. NBC_00565]WUC02731.1 hypothetical protein OG874_39540 [Nocardia sp. NBC_00565]